MSLPSKEQFSGQVDSTFKARLDDGSSFELHLFKLETTISNNIQEAFSLLFRAPLDIPPFQNVFQIEHDELGAFELFLVPIKKKDDCLVFEAVFNNLLV
jgi:hypothetical protein